MNVASRAPSGHAFHQSCEICADVLPFLHDQNLPYTGLASRKPLLGAWELRLSAAKVTPNGGKSTSCHPIWPSKGFAGARHTWSTACASPTIGALSVGCVPVPASDCSFVSPVLSWRLFVVLLRGSLGPPSDGAGDWPRWLSA